MLNFVVIGPVEEDEHVKILQTDGQTEDGQKKDQKSSIELSKGFQKILLQLLNIFFFLTTAKF